MSRNAEKYGPYTLAVACAVLAGMFACCIPVITKPLAAGTMTFGIVVSGFTATQRNMLLGMGGTKVLKFAVRSGYYKDLLWYLAECIFAGLLVVTLSMVRFFIDASAWIWQPWLIICISSIVFVIITMARNEWLMIVVVRRWIEDQRNLS